MASYDIFFFGACFFLLGILLSTAGVAFGIVLLALAIGAFFLFRGMVARGAQRRRLFWLSGLSLITLLGALYATYDEARFLRSERIPFGAEEVVVGVVASNPLRRAGSETWILTLDSPYAGRVRVTSRSFPAVSYGDRVSIEGMIDSPPVGKLGNALMKDRIGGAMSFPAKVEIIGSGFGSPLRQALFRVKQRATDVFKKTLPSEEAAFLAGITFGERGELSPGFRDSLAETGTMHLIALSGYNITILASVVMSIFLIVVRRRIAFLSTLLAISGFVMMTGGEASVVRAALMGGIALLATEAGRIYDIRNAIAGAGFFMAIENPNVLIFDLGFQLSFLALLGIVYLRPALANFFKISKGAGVLAWRKNLLTTGAAQLAVMPFLLMGFGSVSAISLVANIIVLEVIPITMGLGFMVAGIGALSLFLAFPVSWLAFIFLKFATGAIAFFGAISAPLPLKLPWGWWLIYYAALILFVRRAMCRKTQIHA